MTITLTSRQQELYPTSMFAEGNEAKLETAQRFRDEAPIAEIDSNTATEWWKSGMSSRNA